MTVLQTVLFFPEHILFGSSTQYSTSTLIYTRRRIGRFMGVVLFVVFCSDFECFLGQ